ncbi:competence/damage-inducible protein A [bacterium]|nr:competence/damage-inducible protein A [bacterium]
MNAEIIIIGDEILLGLVTDTNSAFIARTFAPLGIAIRRITKVGDKIEDIIRALQQVSPETDIVITGGGLGPTHDDKTRDAVAAFLGTSLQTNPAALDEIKSAYARAKRTMTESNAVQALIPIGADYLSNQLGTAPGIKFHKNQTTFFSLQGVPKELEWMVKHHVVPFVSDKAGKEIIAYRTLRTTGIPESALYEHVKDLVNNFKNQLDIAFLPKLAVGVDVRLTTSARMLPAMAQTLIETAQAKFIIKIHEKYPAAVYAFDDDTMENAVAQLLFKTKLTIATAESCTGGLIAHRLTNVSGSSAYFMQGITTYSNESKIQRLNVPEELIRQHGAVSEEVARAMAEGIRKLAGTDIGVSTTGIAGPSGATSEKPVGLIYIGLATSQGTHVIKPLILPFPTDRVTFKERSSQMALNEIRKFLLTI